MFNTRVKKRLTIAAITLSHLFIVASLNTWLFGHRVSHVEAPIKPAALRKDTTVAALVKVADFPLVALMRAIPHEPGAFGFIPGRVYGYAFLLSYILNSVLWSFLVYVIVAAFLKKRRE